MTIKQSETEQDLRVALVRIAQALDATAESEDMEDALDGLFEIAENTKDPGLKETLYQCHNGITFAREHF